MFPSDPRQPAAPFPQASCSFFVYLCTSSTSTGPFTGSGVESFYQEFRSRLIRDETAIIELKRSIPELRVKIARAAVQMDDSTLQGRLARMVSEGFFDVPKSGNAAYEDLKRCGFACASSSTYAALDKLAEMQIVTKEKGGYQKSPGAIITREEA